MISSRERVPLAASRKVGLCADNGGCETAPRGNWSVAARPFFFGSENSTGVRSLINVGANAISNNGGKHVESIFLFRDLNNFLEFGWLVEQPTFFTSPPTVFNARMYTGVYDEDRLQEDITRGNHRFYMYHSTGTANTFFFRFDGTKYNASRKPPCGQSGDPVATGEIKKQCDDDTTRHRDLEYRTAADDGTRAFWTETHWSCDTTIHFGYTEISDKEFRVDSRIGIDRVWTATCDPLSFHHSTE
ncbi:MAG: hypothetical protein ACRDIC_19540 [bacterium]